MESEIPIQIERLLSGSDLRSLGKADLVIAGVKSQKDFDLLFPYLFHTDRAVVMRAADTIEKITVAKPSYLRTHKKEISRLCRHAVHKELKWHLALLIPRLVLGGKQIRQMWTILKLWARNKDESRIVRVNSLQALYELARKEVRLKTDFYKIILELQKENIPSINARIRLFKAMSASHTKSRTP